MARKLSRAAGVCIICIVTLGSARPSLAQTNRGWKKRWIASIAMLAAAQVLDAHSSWGRYESNPLARGPAGSFSAPKGVLLKSAATGGFLSVQWILMKKMPGQDLFGPCAVANVAAAGVLGGMAARNYRVPRTGASVPQALHRQELHIVDPNSAGNAVVKLR